MKTLTYIAFIFLIFSVFSCEKKDPYQLVWSDEFNQQGKVDTAKWGFESGFIRNVEKQYYTNRSKNARVENGYLVIEAHKEKIANKDYKSAAFVDKNWLHYIPKIDTAQYTSASLTTNEKATWKYAKIEVRAKLPKGVGQWPAIWMLGNNRKTAGWPLCGEIDIMEHVGFDKDTIYGSIHSKAFNHNDNTHKTKGIFIENPYSEFHIYSIEWTAEKIDFLLDGKMYLQFKNLHKTELEWPFDQPFYLKLNNAIGGMWGNMKGVDDSVFPQQMLVDYVRVYQKK